jgi:hypothetical protein
VEVAVEVEAVLAQAMVWVPAWVLAQAQVLVQAQA